MTLRILGSNVPNTRGTPTPSLAELHTILESSVERLSSGISFRSLHSSAVRSATAVEQKTTNADLIRAAENAQQSMAVQERTLALIETLNEDLTVLYGICQRGGESLKNSRTFAVALERIHEHLRPDSKIVSLFANDVPPTPPLQWNAQALQLDLDKPKDEILSKISEAISLLAYAKTRAEADISQSRMVMAKLMISRENKSAAASAASIDLQKLIELTKEGGYE